MQNRLVPIHQLEGYRKLVTKLAWKTWKGLPASTRSWLGVDDIIAEGMIKTFKYISRRYDPKRNTMVITGLYHALHNHFIRMYTEWYWNEVRGTQFMNIPVEKKNKHGEIKIKLERQRVTVPVVSIQAMQERAKEMGGLPMEAMMPEFSLSPESFLQEAISDCFVIPALERVYKEATPKLQDAILVWFLQSGGNAQGRLLQQGKRFDRLSREFRELCFHYHVDCEDCIHVVRSPVCLDNLSRRLRWIPYDLDKPTPQDLRTSTQLKTHLM